MKKFIFSSIVFIFLSLLSIIIVLSTIGIETSSTNNLLSKKINQANNFIEINLETIVYKLDLKDISLFLDTKNPDLTYRGALIPVQNIKVYINFISLIKTDPKIKKINIVLNELSIQELKKFNKIIKPSNLKNLINSRVLDGKIKSEIEVFFNQKNLVDTFIAKGSVKNFGAKLIEDVNINNTKFSFFADNTDILIKNIFGQTNLFKFTDGDLRISLSPEVTIDSSFKTIFKNIDNKKIIKFNKNLKLAKDIEGFEANLINTFFINFDETYKVKRYELKSTGKISKLNFDFKKHLEIPLLAEKVEKLNLVETNIKSNFNSKGISIYLDGSYNLNNSSFLDFNLENLSMGKTRNLKINFDYLNSLIFDAINYKKPSDRVANIELNLKQKNKDTLINQLIYSEGNNKMIIEGISLQNNKFDSLKKITVKTNKDGKTNNDFIIDYGKKILIKGKQFDANQLSKMFSQKSEGSFFSKINKDIEIDFVNILVPLSKKLKNFKLIGRIENGEFVRISSKGDFGDNNFLDITMKNNNETKKKYLEVYSDLTEPLLTEYNFFKGLSGGKLLFTSVIDKNLSSSKLKIEKFKVINAPGMVKLLSLADLGGLADLAEGEGLSFDILEINLEKKGDFTKVNEILALGPSISVLMEGYQNSDIISLRGTLVPAKTLNTIISKIPVIGDIVIPKEAGEGLFGISFKMKGPPGNIKTNINPIRTVTPRFIQRVLDKNKNTK